jgi:hypothetical protein
MHVLTAKHANAEDRKRAGLTACSLLVIGLEHKTLKYPLIELHLLATGPA